MQTPFRQRNIEGLEPVPMIVIPQEDFQYVVPINGIVRIESASSVSRRTGDYVLNGEGNYSYVFLLNGESILISKKIGDCEKALGPYGFIRPHQSHLVYLPFVEKITHVDGTQLVLTTGETVPVSFRKKATIEAHNLLVKIA